MNAKSTAVVTAFVAAITSIPHAGPLGEKLLVKNTGLGTSAIANIGSFYGNGDYNLFSSGVGGGLSYKWDSGVHPFELGLYVAPQFVGTDNKNAISVSTVVHFTFLNSFGFGAGCRFWENGYGGGFKNPSNNRLFMTLGYSFANQND